MTAARFVCFKGEVTEKDDSTSDAAHDPVVYILYSTNTQNWARCSHFTFIYSVLRSSQ